MYKSKGGYIFFPPLVNSCSTPAVGGVWIQDLYKIDLRTRLGVVQDPRVSEGLKERGADMAAGPRRDPVDFPSIGFM